MASVGGPAGGAAGNGPSSTGMIPVSQPANLQPTTNQNSSLVQPVAPGSITQGPPHGSIGSSNAFPGGSSINNSGGTLQPPSTSSSITGAPTSSVGGAKRKEIYKYEAPWTVYSMNWSVRPDKRFRLALGSFVEEYNNKVQIVALDEDASEFTAKSTFDHPYPTTKIMWIPDSKAIFPDLLATSGDYLRVWRAGEPETRLECLLNNNKNSDFCAPLTSFDWNEVDPNLLGTSSIDTTCTIWGLETGQVIGRVNMVTGQVKTQLIAHDKEVYDIAFSKAGGGRDMFASVGADGSVRMFDLRHLEHSTIIYEDPQHTPLLR